MKSFSAFTVAAALAVSATCTHAGVLYNTWSGSLSPVNYQLTIARNAAASTFNYSLTGSPWAPSGLFVDLGNQNISGPLGVTNVSPPGQVTPHASDTTSNSCGTGCTLNGSVPLGGDGEWELVFGVGNTGSGTPQTVSWTTPDYGLSEGDLGLVAITGPQTCASETPAEGCGAGETVYGFPGQQSVGIAAVPEPASLILASLGVLLLSIVRRPSRAEASSR